MSEQKKRIKKNVNSKIPKKKNPSLHEKRKRVDEWEEKTTHLNSNGLKRKKKVHRNKKKFKKKLKYKRLKRIIIELAISMVLLGIIVYIVSLFTFSVVKIEGYSMMPTINNGDRVLVNKLKKIKRFTMILYKDSKSKEYAVRRVVGLPGEHVSYKDDELYINNQETYERFLADQLSLAKESKTIFTDDWSNKDVMIPEGKYLILGDNRPYAIDSREYGYIDETEIIGAVEMRILPIHEIKQF